MRPWSVSLAVAFALMAMSCSTPKPSANLLAPSEAPKTPPMHPVLFRIPVPGWTLPLLGRIESVPIYSYGVMLGLSLVVGWYLTLGLSKRDGLPQETMANNYVITAVAAIAARCRAPSSRVSAGLTVSGRKSTPGLGALAATTVASTVVSP